MQVFHVDSSILGDASASRLLSAAIVDELCRENPSATVVRRGLSVGVIPHLDGVIAADFRATGTDDFDDTTRAECTRLETLVNELLASDMIVAGASMYNFSVPSQLKAWIDRVAQAGHTFKYTETDPVGLTGGKRVIVASMHGGMYSADPAAVMDFQEAYLKAVFGFFGITDVQFVHAERLAVDPDARAQVLEAAHVAMRDVVSKAVVA